MPNRFRALPPLLLVLVTAPAAAQVAAPGKTLAATIDVYVFPSNGQASDQQSKDEAECYNWAATNTGKDPFQLQQQSQAQQEQTNREVEQARGRTRGAAGRGAFGGAMTGALIGEIANDDASEGAAWGAAMGAMSARRRAEAQSQAAQASAQQQGAARQQATAEEVENFKKAMSVCLEAKQYMVKY